MMRWIPLGFFSCFLVSSGLLAQPAAPASEHHHHPPPAAPKSARVTPVEAISIPDVELYDQDGKRVRFYDELVRGNVVAINTIFTTCTTICPLMGVNFSKIYELMSSRIGRGFQLISISIDPVTDTPARLQAWRKKLGGQQGWTLLTGPKPDVDRLLKALGLFAPEKEDHAPIVLLGDDRQGEWLRSNALVSPAKLTATIDKIFSSRDH